MKIVECSSLSVGDIFEQDLFDSSGNEVLPAGQYFSKVLLDELAYRGCERLFAAEDESPPVPVEEDDENAQLLVPYDSEDIATVHQTITQTPALVADLREKIIEGSVVEPDEIDHSINLCFEVIDSDRAAVLAQVMEDASLPDENRPSARGIRMSAMTMVAAQLMGFSAEECRATGRAALLHDISLPDAGLNLMDLPEDSMEFDLALQSYLKHPTRSADLLRRGLVGISELELVLISQVHEQCDGHGFPRGLKRHQLHPLSRLLNLVDAYLTLTDPANPQGGYVAADALGYLVLHSLYGSFDRVCLQALITASAFYPVGSQVRLSNDDTGTVLRSTGTDYIRPIVRLEDKLHEVIDLRRTKHNIVAPVSVQTLRRLPKSLMDATLWVRAAQWPLALAMLVTF